MDDKGIGYYLEILYLILDEWWKFGLFFFGGNSLIRDSYNIFFRSGVRSSERSCCIVKVLEYSGY